MDQPNPERILQTGLAFWASKTLLSAIELGLFTELAKGPQTLSGLRDRLQLHDRAARDFFDTLVALGFVKRDGDRYSNTPETDLFLDRNKPSYVGGILEMANHRLYPFWGHLTEALRTGEPQNEVKGGGAGPVRGALCRSGAAEAVPRGDERHQPRREHGNRAAVSLEGVQDLRRCGHCPGRPRRAGRARQSASARASGSTCRRSSRSSRSTSRAIGVAERVTFRAGSFFDTGFPKADVVLMGHILHDWDLPTKKMLIEKAFDARSRGRRVGRVRSDHRRRPIEERVRPDDEPQHAHRDARRLRLHRRGLRRLDEGGRVHADARRAARRAGFDGRRDQMIGVPDAFPRRQDRRSQRGRPRHTTSRFTLCACSPARSCRA